MKDTPAGDESVIDLSPTQIAPGVQIPAEATSVYRVSETIEVSATLELRNGRYEVIDLTVWDRSGAGVRQEDLRKVTMKDIFEHAFIDILPSFPSSDATRVREAWNLVSVGELEQMKEAGPVTETLKTVAVIYRVARALRQSSRRKLMTIFEISGPTADRWVAKARERGFLNPVEDLDQVWARMSQTRKQLAKESD